MSKHTLVLVRHCQASTYSPGTDKQRPLSSSGVTQAQELGKELKDIITSLDAVLVSPALRAQQTWEEMARGAGLNESNMPTVKTEDVIYSGSPSQILEAARLGSTGYASMVVGHEPTISEVVSQAVELGGDAQVNMGMSTGSAAVVVADKDWHEWHSHVGKLADFVHVRPA